MDVQDVGANVTIDGTDGRNWSASEIQELLETIEALLPKADALPVDKRTKKIPWHDVEITGRSVEECRSQWSSILSKVRTYRIAAEVIADARQLLACQFDQTQKLPVLPVRLQQQVTGYGSSTRHPDYPKKPASAYIRFYSQKLAEVRAEHPEWKMQEIRQHIGELYRRLPETASVFVEKEEDREAFHIARRKFYDDHPELAPKKKKEPPLLDNSTYISRDSPPLFPVSAFNHFFRKHPQFDDRKQARASWNRLSEAEKLVYIDEAVQDEVRYKKDVEEYEKKFPGKEVGKLKTKVTRSDRELIEKLRPTADQQRPAKPLVPEGKPYQLFVLEFLQRPENKKDANWMATAGLAWKNIGASGQQEYARRIEKMWDVYRMELDKVTDDTIAAESEVRFQVEITPRKSAVRRSKSSSTGKDGAISALKRKRQRTANGNPAASADFDSAEKTSKMKGQDLFIFENEWDVRSSFAGLGDKTIREKLEQMFGSLSAEEQENYNIRAALFEEDFYC
ncbi:hypothetical protein RvY_10000 [Ramazzottius varieornatus]|uniref:HMG box domain-containing protein n=1 Tax=Ramazzottius varieornatus TaxID=947166 RepID=A0A1D1VBB4_RAMVA|nr:hypothetical protein RvY_10000 [Ramazzottius varieornatus]